MAHQYPAPAGFRPTSFFLIGIGAFLIQELVIPHIFSSEGGARPHLPSNGARALEALPPRHRRTILLNLGSALHVIAIETVLGGIAEYCLCGATMLVQFITLHLVEIGQFPVESAR